MGNLLFSFPPSLSAPASSPLLLSGSADEVLYVAPVCQLRFIFQDSVQILLILSCITYV